MTKKNKFFTGNRKEPNYFKKKMVLEILKGVPEFNKYKKL